MFVGICKIKDGAEGGNRTRTPIKDTGFSYQLRLSPLVIEITICGLDYAFAFYCQTAVRRESSSLYTFIEVLIVTPKYRTYRGENKTPNLARRCHFKGFTEFDSIHTKDFAFDAQII